MGTSHILAALNKEYWIIHGRSVVNRVLGGYMNCRFWKAKPQVQQMGDLPYDRVNRGPCFKAIGTDQMGPLTMRSGRNSLKR